MWMWIQHHRAVTWPVLAGALAMLLVSAIWFAVVRPDRGVVVGHALFENSYSSIEDLASDADLVVIGTVQEVAGRQIDHGTTDPDLIAQGDGVPVVFYRVDVTERLQGTSNETIVVVGTDLSKRPLAAHEESPLRRGQQVLLFLETRTTTTAPGITLFDLFYVPLNMETGVFDLKLGAYVPRQQKHFTSDSFTLDQVRGSVSN